MERCWKLYFGFLKQCLDPVFSISLAVNCNNCMFTTFPNLKWKLVGCTKIIPEILLENIYNITFEGLLSEQAEK